MILRQSWSEKSSLWRSKSPRHVYSYTAYVWYALICLLRSGTGTTLDGFGSRERSIERLKSATYASSENWYIESTRLMSSSTKYAMLERIAAER